jgi:hypothetical protein
MAAGPGPAENAQAEPTRARVIAAAIFVALFAIAISWFVEWRAAPPPPPQVEIPGR